MKTVGFGINMMYNELDGFERVATFENKETAFAVFSSSFTVIRI